MNIYSIFGRLPAPGASEAAFLPQCPREERCKYRVCFNDPCNVPRQAVGLDKKLFSTGPDRGMIGACTDRQRVWLRNL